MGQPDVGHAAALAVPSDVSALEACRRHCRVLEPLEAVTDKRFTRFTHRFRLRWSRCWHRSGSSTDQVPEHSVAPPSLSSATLALGVYEPPTAGRNLAMSHIIGRPSDDVLDVMLGHEADPEQAFISGSEHGLADADGFEARRPGRRAHRLRVVGRSAADHPVRFS